MSSILRYNDLNKDLINFNKPEKNNQSYFAPISYGETLKPIYIQTPRMNCIINKDNKYIECEINEKNYDFYDFITSLDDLNIRKTFLNSNEWFNNSCMANNQNRFRSSGFLLCLSRRTCGEDCRGRHFDFRITGCFFTQRQIPQPFEER